MTGRFEGRVALVTGGGGGIGRATAIRLARDGATVGVVDIDADGARETARMIGEAAWPVTADIADPADVVRAHREVMDRLGLPTCYVLNAGVRSASSRVPDVDLADFDRVMSVNVRGTFVGLQQAMRDLEAAGRAGSVVITTSIHGLRGSGDAIAYQISKHALVGVVHAAAIDGGPLGIRVNGIAPGLVPTHRDPAVRADMERRARTTPMRRAADESEMAASIAYLLSDDASYVTGHILAVDGGASTVNTVRASGGAGEWDVDAYDTARYGPSRRDDPSSP